MYCVLDLLIFQCKRNARHNCHELIVNYSYVRSYLILSDDSACFIL